MKMVYIIGGLILLFIASNYIYRVVNIDKDLSEKIEKGAVILDVRTEREYQSGHIDGSVNISLGTIREHFVELDTSKTYITYCSHGLRSVKVKNILREEGFRKVYNGGAMSDVEKVIKNIDKKK